MKADASAARGVILRQGAGRVKHLSVKQQWVQERVANHELEVTKIPRAGNWADLMTHHWSESEGEKLLSVMYMERRGPSG